MPDDPRCSEHQGREQVVALMRSLCGFPKRLQTDNGGEFISKTLDKGAYENRVAMDFSRPGHTTDNSFIESFNGSFRDECLITANGVFGHLDSHQLTDETLDFISYDSYPNFITIISDLTPGRGHEPLRDRGWSWRLSVVRSISPHFCVMEQQSGAGGWTNRIAQPALKPGQMRLWTYQSVAHGADMVLYFRPF